MCEFGLFITGLLAALDCSGHGGIVKGARLLGTTRQSIHNWRAGRVMPDVISVRRICEIAAVKTDMGTLPELLELATAAIARDWAKRENA